MKRLFAILLCLCLLLGSVTAFAATGTASTPRANVTDTDPPEIISITLKENKKTLKPGAALHVQMKLDDRSSIESVRVYFYNKAKEESINVYLYYDAASDMYVGEESLTKDNINGSYSITSIEAQDKYGNDLFMWKEKGFGSFKLSGATNKRKTANYKGSAKIDKNGKTVKPGEIINVEAVVSKEYKGIDCAEAVFVLEEDENVRAWCYLRKESSKSFKGDFSFEKGKRNGKYLLKYVNLCKETYYEEGDYYYLDALGSFTVTGQSVTLKGSSSDKTPPKFTATLAEKNKTLTAGDTIHISVKVKDKSDVPWVDASFEDSESVWYWDEVTKSGKGKNKPGRYIPLQYNDSKKKWEGTLQLPKDLPDGKYRLSISGQDVAGNYNYMVFDKQAFTFNSPDYVDEGMKAFIQECYKAIWDKTPTDAEINEYGMPLATGKQKAVDVIHALMKKAGISDSTAADALCKIMLGNAATDANRSATVNALKTGLEYAIDSLNNAAFRSRCKDWGINAGNLGTKAADTKVSSVDVDGGHYVLKGSKATFTGVTDKSIKALVIQDTVKANGKSYKVTAIEGAACNGLTKLTAVTIGKNVTSIGAQAFAGCKKLKTITINTTKLKTVGAYSFGNIKSSAVFKCPKGKAASYEKLIKKTGNPPKKAKFK